MSMFYNGPSADDDERDGDGLDRQSRPVTSGLSSEHRRIERELVAAERAAETGDYSALRATLSFFKTHVALHRKKEEEILFPALARHPGLADGPVRVMLLEHSEERNLLGALADLLTGPDSGWGPEHATRVRSTMSSLSGLLEAHIAKEDQVLYRMAEQILSGPEGAAIRAELDATGYIPADA